MSEQSGQDPSQHPHKHVELKTFSEVDAGLEAFINEPQLANMAALFDDRELPATPYEKLGRLRQIAVEHWDSRKEKTRQQVDWAKANLAEEGSEAWDVIFEAADQLGLIESTVPTEKNPNWLIIPGGANKAPLHRLTYGLESVDSFGQLVYLGAGRNISDLEKENAAEYAPGAETEYDLGCGAFETLLGAEQMDEFTFEYEGNTWTKRVYEFERDGELRQGFVFGAPQKIDGERGANTHDMLRLFGEQAGMAEDPKQSVVIATNAFYSKFKDITAAQELTLAYGTPVETIGCSADYTGVKRLPSQLLQETKSAIDAAVALQDALTERVWNEYIANSETNDQILATGSELDYEDFRDGLQRMYDRYGIDEVIKYPPRYDGRPH